MAAWLDRAAGSCLLIKLPDALDRAIMDIVATCFEYLNTVEEYGEVANGSRFDNR